MLARSFLIRPPCTRLLHSSLARTQDIPQPQDVVLEPEESVESLAAEFHAMKSTHKGAAVTPQNVSEPHDIFSAWKTDTFYAPLAFLRSRRMRAPTRRSLPSVGPGAAEAARSDVFRQLRIDPVHEANNHVLLSAFMTGMGKIRPRAFTSLSWRSQRKVAQAIKRAKHKGVLPILSRPKYYVPRKYRN